MPDNDTTDREQLFGTTVSTKGDWVLQSLVNLVDLGLGMGVTLSIPGSVVSGRLVSQADYLARLTEQFRSASSDESIASVADGFEKIGEAMERPADAPVGWRPVPSDFIHLADARYVVGERLTPTDGMLWRGRISEVSGFSLGHMTQS